MGCCGGTSAFSRSWRSMDGGAMLGICLVKGKGILQGVFLGGGVGPMAAREVRCKYV